MTGSRNLQASAPGWLRNLGHTGVPEPAADVVTTNVAKSLRTYFLGVTIIAAFNGIVIGAAALVLGVPLAVLVVTIGPAACSECSD